MIVFLGGASFDICLKILGELSSKGYGCHGICLFVCVVVEEGLGDEFS